jgi:hypothetical protein
VFLGVSELIYGSQGLTRPFVRTTEIRQLATPTPFRLKRLTKVGQACPLTERLSRSRSACAAQREEQIADSSLAVARRFGSGWGKALRKHLRPANDDECRHDDRKKRIPAAPPAPSSALQSRIGHAGLRVLLDLGVRQCRRLASEKRSTVRFLILRPE